MHARYKPDVVPVRVCDVLQVAVGIAARREQDREAELVEEGPVRVLSGPAAKDPAGAGDIRAPWCCRERRSRTGRSRRTGCERDPAAWNGTYPSLALALRDALTDADGDALDGRAEREAGHLETGDPGLQRAPVWRQTRHTPEAFTAIVWPRERRLVADQLAAAPPADSILRGLLESEPDRRWRVVDHYSYGQGRAATRRRLVQAVTWSETGSVASWLLVPAGPYVAGDVAYDREREVRVAIVPQPIWIARDPVTVAEYTVFLGDGYDPDAAEWAPFRDAARKVLGDRRAPLDWGEQRQHRDRPVVSVTWSKVATYCRWLSHGRTGSYDEPYRLPTEAQWEKAARGVAGRRWPWGGGWRDGLAIVEREWDLANLASCSDNRNTSPFDARGMAGNVWEWTSTAWLDRGYGEPVAAARERDLISLRGGSYDYVRTFARCAFRVRNYAWFRLDDSGFRCARDVSDAP